MSGGGVIPIQGGDPYNLTLQLHDGGESLPKRVFVDLVKADQTQLEATFELPHRGNGLFQENAKIFPNDGVTEEVFAFFRIYESDGTTESEVHGRTHDRYRRASDVSIPENITPKGKSITGEVRVGRLAGEVRPQESVEGAIETTYVEGQVQGEQAVIGDTENNGRIEGTVRESE